VIEKIIIQDSNEVHSVWIPDRRSMASFAVWKAFGLGHHAHWRDGQIMLGIASGGLADHPAFLEFPGYMDKDSIPTWVDAVVARIDASLPAPSAIIDALDDDSATMMLDPPTYRIPHAPAANDIATCIVASRLLLAIPQRLVLPVLQTDEEAIAELDFASRIAILLGGSSGCEIAVSSAADPSLCAIIPDPAVNEHLILSEQDHD
jgi:hypothetical protein